MGAPAELVAYDLAFQVSPIILVGGAYANSLGGAMPILGLQGQLAALGQGILTNGTSTNDFFARYVVLPGGTLISFAVAKYPFANQQTAANAVIQQPTNVSLEMICPVKDVGGYLTKLPILTSMKTALEQHINAGGTFNVATPAYLYTAGLLTGMTDITPAGETLQKQIHWQLDFEFPLITQAQAATAFNTQISMISNGQLLATANTSGLPGSPGTLPGSSGLIAGAQLSSQASAV